MHEWAGLVRARLAAQGQDPDRHAEIVEELSLHLDDVAQAARTRGLNEPAVRAAVVVELDDLGPLRTAMARRRRRTLAMSGSSRGVPLANLSGDLRLAFRAVRRRPAYSAVVILTLAVGIGACTTVFSLFNAVLLKSLPYPDADRLVLLWEADKAEPGDPYIVSGPIFEDWSRMQTTLDALGIWEYLTFNIAGNAEPEQRPGIRASPGLFTTLGVAPAIGRIFTPEEDAQGVAVVVVSDAVWRAHLAADPRALGRSLRLNGRPYEVIGVMPPGFEFPRRGIGGWIPMSFTAQDRERDAHSFFVAARLRQGVTFEAAQAEFAGIGAAIAQANPGRDDDTSVVTRMSEFAIGRLRTMLSILLGAVAFVLLIACVNVASLQLGQAFTRRREFVVRVALGAGLGRLSRQVMLEALVLALAGGAAGVGVAWLGTHSVGALLGAEFLNLPMRGRLVATVDGPALAFTLAVSLTCALLFGFAPLMGARQGGRQFSLWNSTRGATRTAMGGRRLLVAAEIALALVVLCGAGVLLKSLAALLRVNPGLDPQRVLAMQVSLPQPDPYGAASRATFCEDLDRGVEGAGGVFVAHGATSHVPLSGANAGRGFTIDGRPAPPPDNRPSGNYRVTCPGYFSTLGIPIIEGRDFSPDDRRAGAGVVILNRIVAERYWPNESPVGQRLKIGGFTSHAPWLTIVGVAGNVHHFGLESPPLREIYVPYGQAAWPVMNVVVKARGEITAATERSLRGVLARVDPALPAASIRTMDTIVAGSMIGLTSFLRLLGVFAAIGLGLAVVGVYSVLTHYVSQRTRELGVRVALGAPRSSVVGVVLRQSLWPMLAGVAIGGVASLGTNRLLAQSLFQVTPGDPVVLAAIATLLLAIGLAASWLPAWRAAAIDPLVALREE